MSIYDLPYGKDRRKIIVDWFLQNPNDGVYVNRKHQLQTKNDLDFKKLLKKGFLKMSRENYGSARCRQSILVLNKR